MPRKKRASPGQPRWVYTARMIPSRVPFTAALLAGGKSTRMGRDKAALPIAGVPLWARQIATLRALAPDELLISGPASGPWVGEGVPTIADAYPDAGPLGGLATVLARMKCERLLVLAVDLPAMTPEYLRGLLARCAPARGWVPVLDDRFEPLVAIYPRAMAAVAAQQLAAGERSLQSFVRAGIEAGWLEVCPAEQAERALFHNVNTPADLAGGW